MASSSSAPRCLTVFFQVDFDGYISAQKRTKKASQLNVIFDDGQVASLPVKTHERYKKRGKAVASEVTLAGALFDAAGRMRMIPMEEKRNRVLAPSTVPTLSAGEVSITIVPAVATDIDLRNGWLLGGNMVHVTTKGGKDRPPQEWITLQQNHAYKLMCWYMPRADITYDAAAVPLRVYFAQWEATYERPADGIFIRSPHHTVRDFIRADASIGVLYGIPADIISAFTALRIETIAQLAMLTADTPVYNGAKRDIANFGHWLSLAQRAMQWTQEQVKCTTNHMVVPIYQVAPSSRSLIAIDKLSSSLQPLTPVTVTSSIASDDDSTPRASSPSPRPAPSESPFFHNTGPAPIIAPSPDDVWNQVTLAFARHWGYEITSPEQMNALRSQLQHNLMASGVQIPGLVLPPTTPAVPAISSSSSSAAAVASLPMGTIGNTMSPAPYGDLYGMQSMITMPTDGSNSGRGSARNSTTDLHATSSAADQQQQRRSPLKDRPFLVNNMFAETAGPVSMDARADEHSIHHPFALHPTTSGSSSSSMTAAMAGIHMLESQFSLMSASPTDMLSDLSSTSYRAAGASSSSLTSTSSSSSSSKPSHGHGHGVDATPSTSSIIPGPPGKVKLSADMPPASAEAALETLKTEYGCYRNEADTPSSFAAYAHRTMHDAWRAFVELYPDDLGVSGFYVSKTNFLKYGARPLNGGAAYDLTSEELDTLWTLSHLPDVGRQELTFDAFLRLFNFIGHDTNFDAMPFIDLRCLCTWLRHHLASIRQYCNQSMHGDKQQTMGIFTSRFKAQEFLSEDHDMFYCLRLCEGRYDRLVEDQCRGVRQPVHRQLVCTTRCYTADGNIMPGRYVHHLLLNIADEKTPRQRITVLGLDGDKQYDDINWLINSRATLLIQQLQEREIREEMAQRQQDAIAAAAHKKRGGTKKQPIGAAPSSSITGLPDTRDLGANFAFPRIKTNPNSLYRRKGFHFNLHASSSSSFPPLEQSSVPSLDFSRVLGYTGPVSPSTAAAASQQSMMAATKSPIANLVRATSAEAKSEKLSPSGSSNGGSGSGSGSGRSQGSRSTVSLSSSSSSSSSANQKKSRLANRSTPTPSAASPSLRTHGSNSSNNGSYGVDSSSSYHRPLSAGIGRLPSIDQQVDAQVSMMPLSPNADDIYSPASSISSGISTSPPSSPHMMENTMVNGRYRAVDASSAPKGSNSKVPPSLPSATRSPSGHQSPRLAKTRRVKPDASNGNSSNNMVMMASPPSLSMMAVSSSSSAASFNSLGSPNHHGTRLQSLPAHHMGAMHSSDYDMYAKQQHQSHQQHHQQHQQRLSPASDTLPAPFQF